MHDESLINKLETERIAQPGDVSVGLAIAKKIMVQHEPEQPQDTVERVAKAIQQRYWQGDLPISISDARSVCEAFAKAAIAAMRPVGMRRGSIPRKNLPQRPSFQRIEEILGERKHTCEHSPIGYAVKRDYLQLCAEVDHLRLDLEEVRTINNIEGGSS